MSKRAFTVCKFLIKYILMPKMERSNAFIWENYDCEQYEKFAYKNKHLNASPGIILKQSSIHVREGAYYIPHLAHYIPDCFSFN